MANNLQVVVSYVLFTMKCRLILTIIYTHMHTHMQTQTLFFSAKKDISDVLFRLFSYCLCGIAWSKWNSLGCRLEKNNPYKMILGTTSVVGIAKFT